MSIVVLVAVLMPLFALWVVAYWDLLRRPDLSNSRTVMWALVMFVFSYVGILAYAIARPPPQPTGKAAKATIPQASQKVAALEQLVEDHRAGAIPDDQFEADKRRILNLS